MKTTNDNSGTLKLVEYVVDKGIGGFRPLSSAEDLALEYLSDRGYGNHDERVDSLINWETSKNFTSGFLSGFGGVVTLPLAVFSALGASWLIQARMAAAIAHIYGHSVEEDRVRTLVLLSLIGDAGKDVVRTAAIEICRKAAKGAIRNISGKALIEINKRVGLRLVTKAGETGVVNLTKFVPFVGGIVGGGFDALSCRTVGRTAQKLFRTSAGRSPRT